MMAKTNTPTHTDTQTALIESLQFAAKKKRGTPTARDADRRKYGLQTKAHYVNAFGSWNGAIEAANLPINRWRGEATARPVPSREVRRQGQQVISGSVAPPRNRITGGYGSVEDWLDAALNEEREKLAALEMLAEAYHVPH
jgi:hypothetical protein